MLSKTRIIPGTGGRPAFAAAGRLPDPLLRRLIYCSFLPPVKARGGNSAPAGDRRLGRAARLRATARRLDEGSSPAPLSNVQFIRCRTCGRYLPGAAAVEERYCSPECAVQYASCRNCGRFYPAGSGHGGLYCSRECAVRYRLGARPITGEEHT
jgi:hypothetical protein